MDENENKISQDEKKNLTACLGYGPLLFFIPLVSGNKDDKVAQNSARQGLLLLVAFVAISILDKLIPLFLPYSAIQYFNWAMIGLRGCLFVMMIVGMVRAYNGKEFQLPLVGQIDLIEKIKGE